MKTWLFVMLFVSIFMGFVYAGYVDHPIIYTVDQNYVPIKGVEVTVTYQHSWRAGDYVTSLPVLTDDHGKVQLRVTNTVPEEMGVEKTYTVNIRYLNYTDSQTLTYSPKRQTKTYFVIPVNQLTVYIYSPKKGSVNASTNILNIEKQTDHGYVFYHLPPGDYTLNITYEGETFQLPIHMGNQDMSTNYSISEYEPTIEFVDDKGNQLNGTLNVCGKQFNITSPQKIKIVCTADQNATAEVYAKRVIQPVDLSHSNIRFVFDVTRPVVREAVFYANKQSWGVNLDAYDPGVYPSGIKDNVMMSCSVLRPGESNPVVRTFHLVYNKTRNRYYGVFKHEDPGTRIDAVITISDNAGNIETYSTTFIVGEDARINDDSSTVVNTTDTDNTKKQEGGIDWILVIVIIVVVIIIAGVVYYLKNKYSEPV
ncbi:hypothetical protein J7J90_02955 [Candidatus Micrarchaeota archaeon]|nr:hypothetical protein [Candidatus Micrarchaeota archaeon]